MADTNHEMFTKIKNAYLLIYERDRCYDMSKVGEILAGPTKLPVFAEDYGRRKRRSRPRKSRRPRSFPKTSRSS